MHRKSQIDVVSALSKELKNRSLDSFTRVDLNDYDDEGVIRKHISSKPGNYYLITQPHGNWTTIIELGVNTDEPFYLNELTTSLSQRLNTYALSFHLHDDDVLYYNLEYSGESIDGYNSNYQYFLNEVPDDSEILSQRHDVKTFIPILPVGKDILDFDAILNEGYWNAFDNNDLDEDGIPNNNSDNNYDVDEENRFFRIGKYLEIFSKTNYPFANWYINLSQLNLNSCYLLKAEKSGGLFSKLFK
ncbi:hypothetical protein [Mucilaginibacter gracilis]|uniref:hypothetical protein n=1 Tax=Mucilaginibacter gracilis TaxID=423350 RepID=UPI0011C3DD7D|nr:hypothetical protein [Mucilaginibacter gracilis]